MSTRRVSWGREINTQYWLSLMTLRRQSYPTHTHTHTHRDSFSITKQALALLLYTVIHLDNGVSAPAIKRTHRQHRPLMSKERKTDFKMALLNRLFNI